jgi:hypothetical protein
MEKIDSYVTHFLSECETLTDINRLDWDVRGGLSFFLGSLLFPKVMALVCAE